MNLNIKSIALPTTNFRFLQTKLKVFVSSPGGKLAFNKLMSGYKSAITNINNVICKDLNEGLKIGYVSHRLTKDSKPVFEQYLADMETMNILKISDNLLEDFCSNFPSNSQTKIRDAFISWRNSSLSTWDNHLETCILHGMDLKHKDKFGLEFGIYNVTDNKIKESDYELLKNGKKMVLPLHMSVKNEEIRVNEEVLDYAKRFRLYIEKVPRHVALFCSRMTCWTWWSTSGARRCC